jgi:hypothetical protein
VKQKKPHKSHIAAGSTNRPYTITAWKFQDDASSVVLVCEVFLQHSYEIQYKRSQFSMGEDVKVKAIGNSVVMEQF